MIKILTLTAFFSILMIAGFSQADSTEAKVSHYIGVQANQLIRQIFNFSNANTSINNPYLLTYSANSSRSGHGINVGLGYFMNEVSDGDAFNQRETNINNASFRIGWERKTSLGKKWIVSYGLDLTFLKNKNETVTSSESEFNKARISTTNSMKATGFGPRLTLNYFLTNKILLGTELNMYYTKGNNTLTIASTITSQQWDPNTETMRPITVSDSEEIEDDTKKFELSPPVAIFLTVRF